MATGYTGNIKQHVPRANWETCFGNAIACPFCFALRWLLYTGKYLLIPRFRLSGVLVILQANVYGVYTKKFKCRF